MGLNRQKRTAGTAWIEKTNPLAGMSIREAQSIFDCARAGDTQRLHWMFQEIESANPVLMTCVERRVSALSGFRTSVTARPAADEHLADEQRDAITRFLDGIENFTDALEHLDLAFFRGFSYVQPIWEADGTVRHIELPESWLFLTKDGELYYNPVCDGMSRNAELVTPAAKLIGLRRRRPIDYPALSIHIRQAVGDRDWGRFLERIALPKPAVIMAPTASEDEKAKYIEAAERVEDGQVSVWPNGSSLTDFMGGSRGQDPFSSFIRHQEEKIVLLSTGGTLTSLAQADTGSLAGGAQMDVWREIVRKDASVVAQAVNGMVREYLARAFPGQPVAAEFSFDTGTKLTAQEAATVAATLKGAGWIVKQDELEKAVGFTLEKAPETPVQAPFNGLPLVNKAPHSTQKEDHPGIPAGGPRSVAAADGMEAVPPNAVLKAFAEDTGAAAAAVRKLLENPTPDGAAALLHDLPSLIPSDPALAAVLAEAMAAEFGPDASAPSDATEVTNAITNPCPKCHRQMTKDGHCSHCEKLEANRKLVDGLVSDLDKKGPDGKSKGWKDRTENLGELEPKTIDDIKKANPNMRVESSVATINTEQLQHSMNHHGNQEREAKRNQIAITHEDLKRIPEVLADYDSIESGKGTSDGKNQEAVVFRKKYPDGTVACVELDVYNDKMKRRTLKFQTMWKEKN